MALYTTPGNEFFTDEYTAVLQKLVFEVVNDPSTYEGSRILPAVAIPVKKIRTEVIEATGGLTNEHVRGTDVQYIQSFGSRVQEYIAPEYKEAIHYDEDKILNFRELGQNDPSKRGVRQLINEDIKRLNRRLEARIEKLRWDNIFLGGFVYQGKTFSFGIPAFNQATPITGLWSTDGISANNSANPLIDIRYWLEGGLSKFRKYSIIRMIMNPNTARWILDNANTRSFLTSFGANPLLGEYTVQKVLGLLIPGAPEVRIYKGWYQTEAIGTGTTSSGGSPAPGQITVSDGIYFIPDGAIFFEAALPGGDKIGEFVEGIHLATGTVDSPGYGKFIVPEECIAPGTKGGPGNPYIDIVAGLRGGVKLDRAFDVLTASVVASLPVLANLTSGNSL
jgi:hypothetical protein